MRYPIAIEPVNDTTAWGVVVPDIPAPSHIEVLRAAILNLPIGRGHW